MKEGMTHKEKYNRLVEEMERIASQKKESIDLGYEVLDNDDLCLTHGVRSSVKCAVDENELILNSLMELINYAKKLDN